MPAAPRQIRPASSSTIVSKPIASPPPKQEEFVDLPFRGVIHMITRKEPSVENINQGTFQL
jgi:hypothetical protein